jgi:hypothetical protein
LTSIPGVFHWVLHLAKLLFRSSIWIKPLCLSVLPDRGQVVPSNLCPEALLIF